MYIVFLSTCAGTTIKMLRSILEVLMESTPHEIDATRVDEGLYAIFDDLIVHELHIWAITVSIANLGFKMGLIRKRATS